MRERSFYMYSVNILMSTYNGEKYLREQIDSIMNQTDVNIILTIRDDGSSDGTIQIIEEAKNSYPDKIVLFIGENVGYRKSFLELLKLSQDSDYYGFADQDDVWLPEKCTKAIKCLKKNNSLVGLYASSLTITDEKLDVKYKKDISDMPNCIQGYFARTRLSGCTYVFTKELKKFARYIQA